MESVLKQRYVIERTAIEQNQHTVSGLLVMQYGTTSVCWPLINFRGDLGLNIFCSFFGHSLSYTCLSKSSFHTVNTLPMYHIGTLQTSYFYRNVPLWISTCVKLATTAFCSLVTFKRFLNESYRSLLTCTLS